MHKLIDVIHIHGFVHFETYKKYMKHIRIIHSEFPLIKYVEKKYNLFSDAEKN